MKKKNTILAFTQFKFSTPLCCLSHFKPSVVLGLGAGASCLSKKFVFLLSIGFLT